MYIRIMKSDSQVPLPFQLRDEEYKEQKWEHTQKYQRDKFNTCYHAHNQKHGRDICGGRYVTSRRAEHVKTKRHDNTIVYMSKQPYLRTPDPASTYLHTQLQYNPHQIQDSIYMHQVTTN